MRQLASPKETESMVSQAKVEIGAQADPRVLGDRKNLLDAGIVASADRVQNQAGPTRDQAGIVDTGRRRRPAAGEKWLQQFQQLVVKFQPEQRPVKAASEGIPRRLRLAGQVQSLDGLHAVLQIRERYGGLEGPIGARGEIIGDALAGLGAGL